MRIITEDFFIGNLEDNFVTDQIKDCYEKSVNSKLNEISTYDLDASVGNFNLDLKIRKCSVSWMNSKSQTFIGNGLRKIVENVNDLIWKFDLKHEWETDIQFTKYVNKGDHYAWHKDYYDDDPNGRERKLSIVYCLSKKSEYNGGEFQIKTSKGKTYSTKFNYGDFIVFPSSKLHRVKPINSGSRVTMVGWYR